MEFRGGLGRDGSGMAPGWLRSSPAGCRFPRQELKRDFTARVAQKKVAARADRPPRLAEVRPGSLGLIFVIGTFRRPWILEIVGSAQK